MKIYVCNIYNNVIIREYPSSLFSFIFFKKQIFFEVHSPHRCAQIVFIYYYYCWQRNSIYIYLSCSTRSNNTCTLISFFFNIIMWDVYRLQKRLVISYVIKKGCLALRKYFNIKQFRGP